MFWSSGDVYDVQGRTLQQPPDAARLQGPAAAAAAYIFRNTATLVSEAMLVSEATLCCSIRCNRASPRKTAQSMRTRRIMLASVLIAQGKQLEEAEQLFL